MEWLPWVLDAIIVILFLIPVIGGFRRGFVKTVFRCGKFTVALVFAFSFAKKLGLWLRDKFIYDRVAEKVSGFLASGDAGDVTAENLADAVPSGFSRILSFFGADVEDLAASATEAGHAALSEFTDSITLAAANVLSVVLAFFLILLLGWAVLWIFGKLLNGIVTHLPVIKQCNTLLGGILGILIGCLAAWSGAQVIVTVLGFVGEFDYSVTHVLSFVYRVNPVRFVLKAILDGMGTVAATGA